jgi:GNAT superfamily N-acetyltransferase
MLIRDFTADDMPQIIALGRQMHKESSYNGLDFDDDTVMDLADQWLSNPEIYFCRVAEDKQKEIFGMYVGLISSYYFGKDLVANDLLLFVVPDRRGSIAAVKLIKEFEQWAKDKGAAEVRPALSTGVKVEETKQLYEALGYEAVGFTFNKRL